MNDHEKVVEFLKSQTHMVVAVTLPSGQPWAVPVRIQHHEPGVFEWDSKIDTEHSKAIAENPEINLLCYDNTKDSQAGVYMLATVTSITPKAGGLARYHAEVSRTWLNDETYTKREVT